MMELNIEEFYRTQKQKPIIITTIQKKTTLKVIVVGQNPGVFFSRF